MSQAVIAVNNLNKTVPTAAGDLIILDDVNLEVEKGEAVSYTHLTLPTKA